ncbi:cytochrome c oxidase subunit 3 [Halospeciosus flavus]|uniref:Heme-copper oxidase subunit III n=1 Tax=Halospeciosus flavus TaxID=3032283 RepID=A0ABD5Z407_9EURY|nr:heme-copper oxidase subunit III [Halospeciosus flavus]
MTATDESDEHGHHGFLPAVRDFPRGYGEASWWPFFAAVAVTGIYVGASLYVLGMGESPLLPKSIGLGVFGVSAAGFVFSLFGWMYHAFSSHFWEDTSHNEGKSLRMGMLLFLATDIATFSAGFVYYFFIRSGAWSAEILPHGGVLGALVVVNTLLLVTSSFTYHWAEKQLQRGNKDAFMRWLGLTFVIGLVFLAGQAYEYFELIEHAGFTLTSGIYASAFFGLTGLHGLHVSLGVFLIGVILFRAARGQFSAERHVAVTTVSWYWHFVDAVWLFLVAVLYAGAELGLGAH